MFTSTSCLIAAALIAVALTPMVRWLALRLELLDHAVTARKIHGQPVPRLGGIAIVLAFLGAVACAWLLSPEMRGASRERAVALLVGSLAIVLLGISDDLAGAGARQKFVVQFLAAGLVYVYGFRIVALANPFGAEIELGPFSLPFTLLWIVGITNAFNLIDGLDGLAGGVALIALAVNAVIAYGRDEHVTVILCASLAGAVLGFLRYNFHPASLFMGDTGSMFLGFLLATLALHAHQKTPTAVAILVPITALGLPILDTLLAIVRRLAGGRPLFHADREHIHHRLLAAGLTHRRAVLALYGISGLFGVIALGLQYVRSGATTLLISGALFALIGLLLHRLDYLGAGLTSHERDRARAEAVYSIARDLATYGPHEVWEAVRRVSAAIDADSVRLDLVERGADGETVTRGYTAGFGQDDGDRFVVRFRLPGEGRDAGRAEFGWQQPSYRLEPATEEALQYFCQQIEAGRARENGRPGGRVSGGRVVRMSR